MFFIYLLARFALSNMLEVVQTLFDINGTTQKVKAENMSQVSPVTSEIYLSSLIVKGTEWYLSYIDK